MTDQETEKDMESELSKELDDKYLKKHRKLLEKQIRERRLKDVRKLLLENIILGEDGKLTVGRSFRLTMGGEPDGAFGTIFLGISVKEKEYDVNNERKAIYQADEAMKNIGRVVEIPSVEDGHTVLLRHVFFRPVVLIFEKRKDGRLTLTAYCGRDILTFWSMRRAIRLFEKNCLFLRES